MYLPSAGPHSVSSRRAIAAPLPAVAEGLLSRETWRRAFPWLRLDLFEVRERSDTVHDLRVSGAAACAIMRAPLRAVLRVERGADFLRVLGEGEIVGGSRLHLDGEIRDAGAGCRFDLTASADALPPVLRPLAAVAEHRIARRAAAAIESLHRESRSSAYRPDALAYREPVPG